MRMICGLIVLMLAGATPAAAQQTTAVDPARIEAAIKSSWPKAPNEWQARLFPDETMKECTAHHNHPPKAVADAIQQREKAAIQYPPDGKFLGDWKKGERLAQSGYGLRFTDYPPKQSNGGNCYACHQLTKRELSYGTVGPSLLEYGKLRDFKEQAIKETYEKIYDSHVALPCSFMPRFGANKILTIEQITDIVALLMDRDSPVNQ